MCAGVHVCERVASGCLHVVVILGLMKEFSASPLRRSPRPCRGLDGGEGERDKGGNVTGTKRMMAVGEGREKKGAVVE